MVVAEAAVLVVSVCANAIVIVIQPNKHLDNICPNDISHLLAWIITYCNGLNNRVGQKGGLHPVTVTYIHGRNSRGGQNLGQTQAEHANLWPKAAAPFFVYFSGMFSLELPEVLPPHGYCDHGYAS